MIGLQTLYKGCSTFSSLFVQIILGQEKSGLDKIYLWDEMKFSQSHVFLYIFFTKKNVSFIAFVSIYVIFLKKHNPNKFLALLSYIKIYYMSNIELILRLLQTQMAINFVTSRYY